ncbi:MAG: hypothetical protein ACTHU0_34895 [Kofleriaceae bacterium]
MSRARYHRDRIAAALAVFGAVVWCSVPFLMTPMWFEAWWGPFVPVALGAAIGTWFARRVLDGLDRSSAIVSAVIGVLAIVGVAHVATGGAPDLRSLATAGVGAAGALVAVALPRSERARPPRVWIAALLSSAISSAIVMGLVVQGVEAVGFAILALICGLFASGFAAMLLVPGIERREVYLGQLLWLAPLTFAERMVNDAELPTIVGSLVGAAVFAIVGPLGALTASPFVRAPAASELPVARAE